MQTLYGRLHYYILDSTQSSRVEENDKFLTQIGDCVTPAEAVRDCVCACVWEREKVIERNCWRKRDRSKGEHMRESE